MIKNGSKIKFLFFSFLNITRQLTNIVSICMQLYIEKKILYRMHFIRTSLLLF